MTGLEKSKIISRIIELELIIVNRVITDKTFRACDCDEYQPLRVELKMLRDQIRDDLYPPSFLPGGFQPQRPAIKNTDNL